MRLFVFLALAILLTFVVMAVLGGWVLPFLGIEGLAGTLIGVAVSGLLIVLLFVGFYRRQD